MENALINTVIGMGTVFAVLIVIMLVIYAFRIFPIIERKLAERKQKKEAASNPATDKPKAAPGPIVPAADDDVPVAVIMAAIAAYSEENDKQPWIPGQFIVRSIKRV